MSARAGEGPGPRFGRARRPDRFSPAPLCPGLPGEEYPPERCLDRRGPGEEGARGRVGRVGSGTGGESGDRAPGFFPDSSTWVSQEPRQGARYTPVTPCAVLHPPHPPKNHLEWPGVVLAPGLGFRRTWVSVTFQQCDLGLVPYLLLASVSSPGKWTKYSIGQNKDEIRTCGTSANSGLFLFNKYLLHIYYGPDTGLIDLRM